MYNFCWNIFFYVFWIGLDIVCKFFDNGVKVLVGSFWEVVLLVFMDVMDWDGWGGVVGGRRMVGGVGKSYVVFFFGV